MPESRLSKPCDRNPIDVESFTREEAYAWHFPPGVKDPVLGHEYRKDDFVRSLFAFTERDNAAGMKILFEIFGEPSGPSTAEEPKVNFFKLRMWDDPAITDEIKFDIIVSNPAILPDEVWARSSEIYHPDHKAINGATASDRLGLMYALISGHPWEWPEVYSEAAKPKAAWEPAKKNHDHIWEHIGQASHGDYPVEKMSADQRSLALGARWQEIAETQDEIRRGVLSSSVTCQSIKDSIGRGSYFKVDRDLFGGQLLSYCRCTSGWQPVGGVKCGDNVYLTFPMDIVIRLDEWPNNDARGKEYTIEVQSVNGPPPPVCHVPEPDVEAMHKESHYVFEHAPHVQAIMYKPDPPKIKLISKSQAAIAAYVDQGKEITDPYQRAQALLTLVLPENMEKLTRLLVEAGKRELWVSWVPKTIGDSFDVEPEEKPRISTGSKTLDSIIEECSSCG